MADADNKWQLLLFPESASSVSGQVDTLFWAMVVACGLVVALVFTLLLVFGIRYRRGSPASRRSSPLLYHNRWLEIGWSIPVLAAFLFFFAWGALLYVEILDPPTPEDGDVRRVNVIGKQWMWKFQHPEGIREINNLHVAVGQTVRLRMTSQDVIHSFSCRPSASSRTCCRKPIRACSSPPPRSGASTSIARNIAACPIPAWSAKWW